MATPHLTIAAVHAPDWIAVRPTDRPRITRGELLHVLRCGVDAIDVRVARPDRGPSEHERALAALVLELGLRLRCHAWTGLADPETGISRANRETGLQLGAQLGRVVIKLGAESAGANAESALWRGPDGLANPRGAEALDGVAEGFHDEAGRKFLDHLGYADPIVHYGRTDIDGDGRIDAEIPEEVQIRYRRSCVMAYLSTLAGVARRMDRATSVWTNHAASHMEPWLGCGRIDKKHGTIGNAHVTWFMARRYGRATIYIGFDAMGQLLVGHRGHQSIVSLVRSIKTEVVS